MSASILDPAEGIRVNGRTDAPHLTESFLLGEWCVDPANRCARNGNNEVKIDPRNMRVLQILAQHRGRIVSPRDIESLAWEGVVVTPDSIYQSIRQLRQALGDTKSPPTYIETVPRKGYRLVAEVRGMELRAPQDGPRAMARAVNEKSASNEDQHAHQKRHLNLAVIAFAAIAAVAFSVLLAGRHIGSGASQPTEEAPVGTSNSKMSAKMPMDVLALRAQGEFELRTGNANEAMRSFERALQIQLAATGERNENIAYIFAGLALSYSWLGNDSAARNAAGRAVSIINEITPEKSHDRISSFYVLGVLLVFAGEYSNAEQLLEESVALAREHYGEGASATIDPIGALALLRHAQGELEAAEALSREVVDTSLHSYGPQATSTAYWRSALAFILIDASKFTEAENQARLVVAALEAPGLAETAYMPSAKYVLAEALVKQGHYDEGEVILHEVMTALEAQHADDWRTGRAAGLLGESLLKRGEFIDANKFLTIAERKLAKAKGWPVEREQRNTRARRDQLNAALRFSRQRQG